MNGASLSISPALFHAAVQNIAEGIVITDGIRSIKWVNPAFTALTGYSLKEVAGRNLRILKYGSHRPEFHPVHDQSGAITNFVVIFREPQLSGGQSASELVAGSVAHDFNNLLAVMRGYCDLLLTRENTPEEASEYVNLIRIACDRAASLAGGLLAHSRHETQEPHVLDLNEVVRAFTRLFGRLLPANIEFNAKLEPQLAAVLADDCLTHRVLMNLVVNARDAMPQGGKLEIETANLIADAPFAAHGLTLPPGSYVLLAVIDAGIGMDEETTRHLFEPFYTTKPPGKGAGLGLFTVHGIVQRCGGGIHIQSRKGEGTSVKVYLPSCSA